MIKVKLFGDYWYVKDLVEKSKRVKYRISKKSITFYFSDPKIAKAVLNSIFDIEYCLNNIKLWYDFLM